MKTIGKIAALAMTLSLAFVLTACGGNASSKTASSSASASSASASAASASASAESVSAESPSASAASASAPAASSAASNADRYENAFFGIAFDLPEGWSFVDTSTIGSINDAVAAASKNAKLDMAALNADKSELVTVAIEDPSDANAGKTAEQYLEAQEEQMKESLEGNYAYSTTSATITFNGIDRELPASITDLNVNGNHIFICQAVAEKDGYFFYAISMAGSQDEVTTAFENFKSTTA